MRFYLGRKIESLAIVLILLLPFSLLVGHTSPIFAVKSGNPNVCPAGNVKYEADGGYEYNDGSGGITILGNTANWGPTSGYEVIQVCIKAGQDLFYPSANTGTFATPKKDISHIVLYTKVSEDVPNGKEPPTNGTNRHRDEDDGEVLGGMVLPETGVDGLGLVLATFAFQAGLLLRRKILTS